MDDNCPGPSGISCSTSNATGRLARLYNVDQAQIMLDDMPSDLSEEELDSDTDDPTYEPEPAMTSRLPEERFPYVTDAAGEDDATIRDDRPRRWKKVAKEDSPQEFNHTEGPVLQEFENCTRPVDFFMKFYDRTIEDNILFQSNLYINQKQRAVTPITLPELRGFIGINMVMGYHILPSYTHYWSTQPDLHVEIVASTMTKGRFQSFLSNLHVNDDTNAPTDDKLWKLRPLIDRLNNNFTKLYDVNRCQSIDESMILFKGRSCLKQYCPMKPIKRGYKLWVRADTNGYISKISVYQGRGTKAFGQHPPTFGLGESVVASLCSDILQKGHTVFFDNFFTSIPLLSFLQENGTNACGTIRANRKGLPTGLKPDKELERGDFDYRVSDDGILYCKWMDNKAVTIASNFHGTDPTNVLRTQKDGTREQVPCPQAVKDYNQHMGGVDMADMLCGAYGLSRKSKKWWHRIFFGLLDRALVNAFIVYKLLQENKSHLDFHREVALALLTMARPPKVGRPFSSPCASPRPEAPNKNKRRKGNFSVTDAVRLQEVGLHYVVYRADRGRCEVCSSRGIQSRPHSKCRMCNVFLCCNEKKNCFLEYHDITVQ